MIIAAFGQAKVWSVNCAPQERDGAQIMEIGKGLIQKCEVIEPNMRGKFFGTRPDNGASERKGAPKKI